MRDVDVVHAHGYKAAALVLPWTRLFRIPLVVTWHNAVLAPGWAGWAGRLLQHVDEEAGDAARGRLIAGIDRDLEQLRVVGQHPLIVRLSPVATCGVAEEPAFDRVAERRAGHRGERAIGDRGGRGVRGAHGC